jgi:16S rRNA (adenine1518-N6/adenine1519-N6)-dimethyltransferase
MNQETKKSLGQHWLHDADSLAEMVNVADIHTGDFVLEIGPGLGTLTELLLQAGATVQAVEFDHELIPSLKKKFNAYNESFRVEQADILKYDLNKLQPGYKVAANIPYYLTSNILRLLCEAPNHFDQAALLVQKEVAERVCAEPGAMSILSISVQLYADVSLGAVVPAYLFTPPPKVDSQILILKHLGRARFDVDTRQFFRLVKAGFSERRKKLRSSLSGGLGITKTEAEDILRKADIDIDLRAQALSLEDWYRMYATFYA